jgi:hypothetical protein
MKQCMYTEVRPHMYGDLRRENVNSHWWLLFLLLVVSGDRLAIYVGPT